MSLPSATPSLQYELVNVDQKKKKTTTPKPLTKPKDHSTKSSYVMFRMKQVRQMVQRLPRARAELVSYGRSVRRYRTELARSASVAKKLADSYRGAVSYGWKNFKAALKGAIPRALCRSRNVQRAKYADMCYEQTLVDKGGHEKCVRRRRGGRGASSSFGLRSAWDIGTLREGVVGSFCSVDDQVASRWLGVVHGAEEERRRCEELLLLESGESSNNGKSKNVREDYQITKGVGEGEGEDRLLEECFSTVPRASWVEGLHRLNVEGLAKDFVNKISRAGGECDEDDTDDDSKDFEDDGGNDVDGEDKSQADFERLDALMEELGEESCLYEVFSLLPDPKPDTHVWKYWNSHCRQNEKRWFEKRILGEKRLTDENCPLVSEDTYLKPKVKQPVKEDKRIGRIGRKSNKSSKAAPAATSPAASPAAAAAKTTTTTTTTTTVSPREDEDSKKVTSKKNDKGNDNNSSSRSTRKTTRKTTDKSKSSSKSESKSKKKKKTESDDDDDDDDDDGDDELTEEDYSDDDIEYLDDDSDEEEEYTDGGEMEEDDDDDDDEDDDDNDDDDDDDADDEDDGSRKRKRRSSTKKKTSTEASSSKGNSNRSSSSSTTKNTHHSNTTTPTTAAISSADTTPAKQQVVTAKQPLRPRKRAASVSWDNTNTAAAASAVAVKKCKPVNNSSTGSGSSESSDHHRQLLAPISTRPPARSPSTITIGDTVRRRLSYSGCDDNSNSSNSSNNNNKNKSGADAPK